MQITIASDEKNQRRVELKKNIKEDVYIFIFKFYEFLLLKDNNIKHIYLKEIINQYFEKKGIFFNAPIARFLI